MPFFQDTNATTRPDPFPDELRQALDTQHQGVDMLATVVKGLGPFVVRVPTAAQLEQRERDEDRFRSARIGIERLILGDEILKQAGCLIHPDASKVREAFEATPGLPAQIMETLNVLMMGVDREQFKQDPVGAGAISLVHGEVAPAWCADAIAEARKLTPTLPKFLPKLSKLHAVPTEFGVLVFRTPTPEVWDMREAQSPGRAREEGFALNCLVYPSRDAAKTQFFGKRPLMPSWISGLLLEWASGDLEVHATFL